MIGHIVKSDQAVCWLRLRSEDIQKADMVLIMNLLD